MGPDPALRAGHVPASSSSFSQDWALQEGKIKSFVQHFPQHGKSHPLPTLCEETLGIFQINKLTFFFFIIIPWSTFYTQIIVGRANMVIKKDILLPFNTLFSFALFFPEIMKN